MSNAFSTYPQIEDTGTPVGDKARTINFLNSTVTQTAAGVIEVDPAGAGGGITDLTGDVSATGPGSAASTVDKLQTYTLDLSTPPTNGQVLTYNGSAFSAATPAAGSISLLNGSASGTSLIDTPGTASTFYLKPIQAGRGLSISASSTPPNALIFAGTSQNVAYVTDVQRTSVAATGTGSPVTTNLQLSTLTGGSLGSSTTQFTLRSLLRYQVGTAGGGTILTIVMDGSTTLFTLNLDSGLISFQDFYLNFGFNCYTTGPSNNSAYFVTYAQNTPATNLAFTPEDTTQVTNVTSFNKSIAHTFQVKINITSTDVTCTNLFSSLQNY